MLTSPQPPPPGEQVPDGTRAVIVHSLPLMRLGIATALAGAGVTVGGEAASLAEGLDLAFEVDATLLVVGDGVADDAREIILNDFPPQKTLILLRQATREDLVELVSAGVGGITRRLIEPARLGDVAVRVCAGEQVVEPELVPLMFGAAPTRT